MQHALGDGVKRPASPPLEAVKAYLVDHSVKGATTALAGHLDQLTTQMIDAAAAQANAAIAKKPAGTARQKSAIDSAKQAVTAGKGVSTPFRL